MRKVAVTLGADGAYAASDGFAGFVPAPRVNAVDGTGAGDAFAAGLLYGELAGWPFERSVRFANAVGAVSTTALGAGEGLPSVDEALAAVRARMSPQALTYEQVAAWRIGRHHLVERAPRERLEAVARDVCGVQAQVMSSAALALWTRVDTTPADVFENRRKVEAEARGLAAFYGMPVDVTWTDAPSSAER